jgi:mannose-1-phosphate guanylyltransferase
MHDFVHEWVVILAGGEGTRLRKISYLVSGDHRPKQFCTFFGRKSLLTPSGAGCNSIIDTRCQ